MALPANADVRRLLHRIRPNAKWGWKGGTKNDPAQIRWRDPVQIEPLEAEYATEQVAVDADDTERTATRNSITNIQNLIGVDPLTLSLADTRRLLTILLLERGALRKNGTLRAFVNWNASDA